MTINTTSLWRSDPNIEIRWQVWGDETIIYNCNSGDTHLLNRVSADALKILQKKPMDVETLTNEVATRYGLHITQELLQHMDKLLFLFSDLGIIIPANEA